MELDYRAGLFRACAVLAIPWVVWGLYRPIADWKKKVAELHEISTQEETLCKQDNEAYSALAASGLHPRPPLDCESIHGNWAPLDFALEHKSVYSMYRDAGILKTAGFCFLPPLGGYLLVAALISAIVWVRRGFREPGRGALPMGGRQDESARIHPRLPPGN
jgi:hypothetical protein